MKYKELFKLQKGDKFFIRLFPIVFTVVTPFSDTVGLVEVSAKGFHGNAHLIAMTEVMTHDTSEAPRD